MQVFSWVFQSITRVVSVLSVFVRCYHSLVTDNSDHLNGSDCQVPPLTLAGCAFHFFQVKMIGFRFPNLHHLIGNSVLPNGASPLSCWSSVWQPNRMPFSPVFQCLRLSHCRRWWFDSTSQKMERRTNKKVSHVTRIHLLILKKQQ